MGWTFYNASGQQLRNTGTVLATQAEMEAGSSIAAFVTPGRTQYHPGVAKAWCRITEAGLLVAGDYNIDSVTDTDTGIRGVVFDTDFASNDFVALATGSQFHASTHLEYGTFAVGSVVLHGLYGVTGAIRDYASSSAFFGDQ